MLQKGRIIKLMVCIGETKIADITTVSVVMSAIFGLSNHNYIAGGITIT